MARRSSFAALLTGLLTMLVAAPAQAAPLGSFGHDDSLDGTPGEIVSGYFGGDDPSQDPIASRTPGTFETYSLTVPAGTDYGGLSATVRWEEARLDFDIYLYRQRPDGTLRPGALASAASFGTPFETLTFRPAISGDPVPSGTYVLVVDNWCTRDAEAPFDCEIGPDVPDEDDFIGSFESLDPLPSNPRPSVTLAGPDAVKTGDPATFTATATDDGAIRQYAFDLDGDGRFESDNGQARTLTRRFDAPGARNVGVRVTDDEGGQSFANRRLTVSAPPAGANGPGSGAGGSGAPGTGTSRLLAGFSVGRPVFGGRRALTLPIRYRLRERATVDLALYRGSRRVRTLAKGVRGTTRIHRVTVSPRRLRRGTYTVYLSVRTADGRTQVVRLASRRL